MGPRQEMNADAVAYPFTKKLMDRLSFKELEPARQDCHYQHVEAPHPVHPTLGEMIFRFLVSSVLIGLAYAALYLSIGEPFYYGGPAWSTMLIWAAAQGGGWIFGMLRLPALLGMLLVGLILRNAAPSSVEGLPSSWSAFMRTAALGIIFMRSGVELNLSVYRRVGGAACRLLLLPGLTEAVLDGLLSVPLLGLPLLWGFSLGFILKAVGPAIIITTMSELTKERLGVAKGIPSILVAAASFDDMVAITGYGLFSNFAFAKSGDNLGWQIAHGPVEIVLGAVGGVVGGLFCSATRMWRSRYQRTVVSFLTAITLIFVFYRFNMRSAGPLAALVTGMVMRICSDRGIPGALSLGPNKEYSHQVEKDLGVLWRWVAQPLLFGIIGTLVNLRTLKNPGVLPRSLALIIIGLVVRVPISFMAVAGAGLTWRERLFVAVAWTPKATVQAALGPLPLDTIRHNEGPDSPNIEYAETILTTSVLAILVCGSIGVLTLHALAPRFLAKGADPSPGTEEWKQWKAQQAADKEAAAQVETAELGRRLPPVPQIVEEELPEVPEEQRTSNTSVTQSSPGGAPSLESEDVAFGGGAALHNHRRAIDRPRVRASRRRFTMAPGRRSHDDIMGFEDAHSGTDTDDSEGSYSHWRHAVGSAIAGLLPSRTASRVIPMATEITPVMMRSNTGGASIPVSPSAPALMNLADPSAVIGSHSVTLAQLGQQSEARASDYAYPAGYMQGLRRGPASSDSLAVASHDGTMTDLAPAAAATAAPATVALSRQNTAGAEDNEAEQAGKRQG